MVDLLSQAAATGTAERPAECLRRFTPAHRDACVGWPGKRFRALMPAERRSGMHKVQT